MDKVIIDKVDVSECKYCASGYFCNKPMSKKYCSENTDCDYKQLQRAKAENEELQGKYNGLNANYNSLKFENERLKKQYNCYACDSCGGKEDYINMKRHTENAIKTVHKYGQALQEIRDIAGNAYENDSEYQATGVYNEIIQKITKAEEENE